MVNIFEFVMEPGARLKVIGVGGGGGNAIANMLERGLDGVEFIVGNTDAQALARSTAPIKLQLGAARTRGLGAGARPESGRQAVLESESLLAEHFAGADMVFVTAGMGGGTGSGGAAEVARIAREAGALVVAVVTRPFDFEGSRRQRNANEGIAALAEEVDTLVTIPNQRLLSIVDSDTGIENAFKQADDVLYRAVMGISDLITKTGMINVDFADVREVMTGGGVALMGMGCGTGESRALKAVQQAISSPLLDEVSIDGATGILLNFTGGPDMSLAEINEAATLVSRAAAEDVNLIFGTVIDEALTGEVRVTVIATGFPTARAYPVGVNARAGRGYGAAARSGSEVVQRSPGQSGEFVPQISERERPQVTREAPLGRPRDLRAEGVAIEPRMREASERQVEAPPRVEHSGRRGTPPPLPTFESPALPPMHGNAGEHLSTEGRGARAPVEKHRNEETSRPLPPRPPAGINGVMDAGPVGRPRVATDPGFRLKPPSQRGGGPGTLPPLTSSPVSGPSGAARLSLGPSSMTPPSIAPAPVANTERSPMGEPVFANAPGSRRVAERDLSKAPTGRDFWDE